MRKVEEKKDNSVTHKLSNVIDRFVAIFSPQAAYKRAAFRTASNMLSSYRGARIDRTNSGWITSSGSADADTFNDLPVLRERSRDLIRNSPYAGGIANTMTTNTIGNGIRPQSRVRYQKLGITQEQALEFQAEAEKIWSAWCKVADISGRLSFYQIQALVDRQIIENGEVFALAMRISDSRRQIGLAYDIIEADRVDSPYGMRYDPKVRMGIQLGEYGQPVKYYIREGHPGDVLQLGNSNKALKWNAYDATDASTGLKNVYHLYLLTRPGQTRGVPMFAPVIAYFQHLDKYLEAELVAARVAACFAMFITKTSPEAAFGANTTTDSDGKRIETIEPASINYLSPGESVQNFSPQRPGNTFDVFVMQLLRQIGASLNMPYELVTKDFSRSNYANMRASLLQAYRYFRCRQHWLNEQFNQPTYERVIEEAVLRGHLKAPKFYKNRDEWTRARWISEGWEWVDPEKEANAAVLARDNNFSTLEDICASRGNDWEEVVEQKAKELQKIKELEGLYDVDFSVNTPSAKVQKPAENAPADAGANQGGQ